MRKIYNIMMSLACLAFFWACETDIEHPIALTPNTFVLNTPVYVSGIYDLKNTETIQLTCSQPDYGFTAVTIYRVQIATDVSFQEFVTLPTPFNTAKIDLSASEIAVALMSLLDITDEADFPTETFPVYIRLSAELSDSSHEVLSNIIELPKVKSYFALEPMVMPENIYLIGNVTNWSWDAATQMIPVHGTEGK
ncbi:MAG: SusE domain-containing protein, partial [Dysgonamonadaceae bacterium]|nr:SusE domain-containing protein [Dysgonamonadaceae bacterium]